MMKPIYRIGLVVVLFCTAATAFSSRKDEVTLLLIPREDGAMRVGMDIANRYPTLLLSYNVGARGSVSLHGWTGQEWVSVSLKDFHSGGFFKKGPDSALVIENDGDPVPETIIPSTEWCGSVYKITTTDIRPMLHLVGQYYDFKFKEWDWFAKNYHQSMDAINPERLNVSWYHKRFAEHLKKKDTVVVEDLKYWVAIRHPQSTPVETDAVASEIAEEIEAKELSEIESVEDPVENPLTKAIPEAIVLGADDAEESKIDASTKIIETE